MSKHGKLQIQDLELRIVFFFVFFCFSCFALNAQLLTALTANAGSNTGVCPGDTVKIGGSPSATGGTPPYTYSWQPATGLDFPNAPNPDAFPSAATDYTLTVNDGAGNSSFDIVNVTIYSLPAVNAGADQTILEGTNTVLQASGAVDYYWTPTEPLFNQNSANPVAEPNTTTVLCVLGVDGNGCTNADCMTLYVIPSDTILIYNSFSPNGDGLNDFFYISNIEKYTENKLEVFNRNGKLVYQKTPYQNDWNGRIDGVDLPCATYYFILTPGKDKSKMQGAVTIIR